MLRQKASGLVVNEEHRERKLWPVLPDIVGAKDAWEFPGNQTWATCEKKHAWNDLSHVQKGFLQAQACLHKEKQMVAVHSERVPL